MSKKILILLFTLTLIGGALYLFTQEPAPKEEQENNIPIQCDTTHEEKVTLISEFENHWTDLETEFQTRPVQGSTGQEWLKPTFYQFIANNRFLISFEDGHIMMLEVIEYTCRDKKPVDFVLLGQEREFPFLTVEEWDEFLLTHGDTEYTISNYTSQQQNTWTETQENLFIIN